MKRSELGATDRVWVGCLMGKQWVGDCYLLWYNAKAMKWHAVVRKPDGSAGRIRTFSPSLISKVFVNGNWEPIEES